MVYVLKELMDQKRHARVIAKKVAHVSQLIGTQGG